MPLPEGYSLPKKTYSEEFEVLPEGMYHTEIVDIKLKIKKAYSSDEDEEVFAFTFAIVNGSFKSRLLWKDARVIMSAGWEQGSPSWLYKIYCAATKKKLTDDEAQTVTSAEINDLIGKQVLLLVTQKPKKDGTLKNSIDNILAATEHISYEKKKKEQKSFEKEIEDEAAALQENVPPVGEEINVDDIPF